MQDRPKVPLPFERVRRIAVVGIERASRFARFVASSPADYESYCDFHDDATFIQLSMGKPLEEDMFGHWSQIYQNWSYCNAVNEIVEAFYIFIEQLVVTIKLNGQTIELRKGQTVLEVLNEVHNKARFDNRHYHQNKDYLKNLGVFLSEAEDKILSGFIEIRNLLTHNAGYADERKYIEVRDDKIVYRWYRPHLVISGSQTGNTYHVDDLPVAEETEALIDKYVLHERETVMGEIIQFSHSDVQEISWTFNRFVELISERMVALIQKEEE